MCKYFGSTFCILVNFTLSAPVFGLIRNNIPSISSTVKRSSSHFQPISTFSFYYHQSSASPHVSACDIRLWLPSPLCPRGKIIHHILPLCPPCSLWQAPALSWWCGHTWVPILSSGVLRVVTRARRSGEADIRTCMHKRESIKPHVKQSQHVPLPFPMMESFYPRWPWG